jgi:hypothetical protein
MHSFFPPQLPSNAQHFPSPGLRRLSPLSLGFQNSNKSPHSKLDTATLPGAGWHAGTHDALMVKGEQYAELYNIQAAAYR